MMKAWMDSECFLRPFFTIIGRLLAFLEPNKQRVKMTQPKWVNNGPQMGQMDHLWVILDHFWDVLVSLWGQFGIVLASFGIISGSFCDLFDLILTSFLAICAPFSATFWDVVCGYGLFVEFWWCIETSNTKMSKMRQYNAKKKPLFFGYKTPLLL